LGKILKAFISDFPAPTEIETNGSQGTESFDALTKNTEAFISDFFTASEI